jgi:GntR family transcriptional regulator / MocR family aminotransferase
MREGHYLRHLRRTKRVYAGERDALLRKLRSEDDKVSVAGLTVLLRFPAGKPDIVIARETLAFGIGPSPLSAWYASPEIAPPGLLLRIATSPERQLEQSCDRLIGIIKRFT